MLTIFTLLAVYQLKHFLADYPLQRPFMLRKLNAEGWAVPLLAHACVHGGMTLLIALFFVSPLAAFGFMLADSSVHFFVDRAKANASRGMTPAQPQFWWALGADQAAHHLTHYFIIYGLMTS